MDLTTFLIQCLNSVQYGLLLFLVASGLTLIFGIMGVINLAHGSFYMIGAYMAFTLSSLTGNFFVALVLGMVLAVALGYLLEWGFFSFLYEREHLMQVLMTYGLILVFEELRSILVGDDVHGVAVPDWLAGGIAIGNDMSYPVYRLFISAVCLALRLEIDQGRVSRASIGVGGLAATPARAVQTEAALLGQAWNETTVRAAMGSAPCPIAPPISR